MEEKIIIEDEKETKKTVNVLQLVAVGAAVFGAGYLMGGLKGIEIGRKFGQLDGYKKATSEFSKIIRES